MYKYIFTHTHTHIHILKCYPDFINLKHCRTIIEICFISKLTKYVMAETFKHISYMQNSFTFQLTYSKILLIRNSTLKYLKQHPCISQYRFFLPKRQIYELFY